MSRLLASTVTKTKAPHPSHTYLHISIPSLARSAGEGRVGANCWRGGFPLPTPPPRTACAREGAKMCRYLCTHRRDAARADARSSRSSRRPEKARRCACPCRSGPGCQPADVPPSSSPMCSQCSNLLTASITCSAREVVRTPSDSSRNLRPISSSVIGLRGWPGG